MKTNRVLPLNSIIIAGDYIDVNLAVLVRKWRIDNGFWHVMVPVIMTPTTSWYILPIEISSLMLVEYV